MMASKRSAINCLSCAQVFTAFVFFYAARLLHGYTNPADVAAINCLYAALGYPSLPGWVPNGGDPCTESWQGVLCNNTDISSIILIDANLGGELGDCLSSFSSIKEIQLGNNNIGGSIPSNLPVTLQTLSLNGNQLTGEIPDVFQGLIGLFNLDLSSNNLSGQLPPSLENLSSLTTLHLQNNQLSGTLDDLQDLTIKDLNIENNLFNGPIPDKLLSILNFKKDGNPFTPLPSPTSPTTPPPPPPFSGPPCSGEAPGWSCSGKAPWEEVDGPCEESKAKRCKKTTNRVVWIATAGVVLSLVILVLVILLFMSGNRLSCKMDDIKTQGGEIKTQISKQGGEIKTQISKGDDEIKTQIGDVKTQISKLGGEIKTQISKGDDEIKTQISKLGGEIKTQISKEGDEIKTQISKLGGEIKTQISRGGDEIKTQISNEGGEIKTQLREIQTQISNLPCPCLNIYLYPCPCPCRWPYPCLCLCPCRCPCPRPLSLR